MKRHFENEITYLNDAVLRLGSEVEEALSTAVSAAIGGNVEIAAKVIEHDNVIDQEEIRIEEECLKILALHQPMVGDLRYVIALLKMNNELERIGDLAANIAERALNLAEAPLIPADKFDFESMVNETRNMFRSALNSLVGQNSQMAAAVIRKDDEIDAMHSANFHKISRLIPAHPELSDYYLSILSVSRSLERIADCATNICEDVIYLEQGRIVRHTKNLLS